MAALLDDRRGVRVDSMVELVDGKIVKREIPLSTEAFDEFSQFAQFAHTAKKAFEGREREWFANITAHALRLAGTLTYLTWAMRNEGSAPVEISADHMRSAIRLVRDYFWPHARACLRQIGLTERHANARKALRWIAAHHKTEVSREAIRRDALGQRLDADQTTELLAVLCNFGWMREQSTPSGPLGGKPVRR